MIENKHKMLCRICAPGSSTKSWRIGIGDELALRLRERMENGWSLIEMAVDIDVTEQTMIKWFKRCFSNMTFRDLKKEMVKNDNASIQEKVQDLQR